MDMLEFRHYKRGIRLIIWHERFPSQNKASLICIWYADNTYPTYHFNSNIHFNVIKARLLSYRWVRNKISSSLLRRLLMELVGHYLMSIVETGDLFALLLFITFYLYFWWYLICGSCWYYLFNNWDYIIEYYFLWNDPLDAKYFSKTC